MAAPGFGAKKLWTSAALAGRRGSGAVFRRVVFFLAAGFLASPDDDDRGRAPLDRARGFGAGASGTGGGDRAARVFVDEARTTIAVKSHEQPTQVNKQMVHTSQFMFPPNNEKDPKHGD